MSRNKNADLDRVLRAATRVFLERGFSATSMSDLVAATGMNRAGLYAAFGSKHQLYITALQRYRDDTEPELRSIARRALDLAPGRAPDAAPERAPVQGSEGEGPPGRIDAPRVLGELLDVVARQSKEGGFIVRAAVELADDPATMRRVQDAWGDLERDLAAILARAVELGELDPAADPGRLARTALVFVQGALVTGHADEEDGRLADAAAGLVDLLAAYRPSATDDPIRSQADDDALLSES